MIVGFQFLGLLLSCYYILYSKRLFLSVSVLFSLFHSDRDAYNIS